MMNLKTADDVVTAMAYDRDTFKDKVEEKVGGALLEHYKACLSRVNRQTRWVEHWQREVDRLLDTELVVVLLHTIKEFKDRRKAAREVLRHLEAADVQYRRAAERVVKKDYSLKKLGGAIPDDMTAEFYTRVNGVIDLHS
jgi:predicted metal-dependent RNase